MRAAARFRGVPLPLVATGTALMGSIGACLRDLLYDRIRYD